MRYALFVLLLILLCSCLPEKRGALVSSAPATFETVLWEKPVDHLFFHSLLVVPQRAYDSTNWKGFDDLYVTASEFRSILGQLYHNNYVLVDIMSLYCVVTNSNSVSVVKNPLYLPVGKKPLLLSFDDVNYYPTHIPAGIANKLVLDDAGEISAEYVDESGAVVTNRNGEHISMIEEFVRLHPDFSWSNGRGMIALTGYQGVLGYRTHDDQRNKALNYRAEREKVAPLIARLKERGWRFASHSNGHHHNNTIPVENLARDFARWKANNEILTGPTPLFIYPFGEGPLRSSHERLPLYLTNGFNILFTVSLDVMDRMAPDGRCVFLHRVNVDGMTFRGSRGCLAAFFDVSQALDPIRPVSLYGRKKSELTANGTNRAMPGIN